MKPMDERLHNFDVFAKVVFFWLGVFALEGLHAQPAFYSEFIVAEVEDPP